MTLQGRSVLSYRLLFNLSIFVLFFTFYAISNGLLIGSHLMLLLWSSYIVCFPAGHGQLIASLFSQKLYTEPFFLAGASSYLFLSYILTPNTHTYAFLTFFFHVIIFNPMSYGIIFLFSIMGTLYNLFFKLSYFSKTSFIHTCIRSIIILVSVIFFFYLTHQDFVIMINALT